MDILHLYYDLARPLVLIGAKINESFYLYDAGFGISGKDRVKTSSIVRIKKDYKAIISEVKFAYLCIPYFQSAKYVTYSI